MQYLYLLDWIGLTIGTIGTILWAHNGKYAKYTAIFWFISSLLWIAFAYLSELTALGIRDVIPNGIWFPGFPLYIFAYLLIFSLITYFQ